MFALNKNFNIFNKNFVFDSLININKNTYVFLKKTLNNFDIDQFLFNKILKVVEFKIVIFVKKIIKKNEHKN